jgi:hypothetical protein
MTQVKKRGHSYRSAYMGVAPPPPNPTTHKHAHTQSLNLQVASYNEHTIALCAPDAASGTALLSMEFLKDLRWVGGHTHMSVNKQPCGARLPDVPWAHTHLYLPHQSPHTPKTNTYQPTNQPTNQPNRPPTTINLTTQAARQQPRLLGRALPRGGPRRARPPRHPRPALPALPVRFGVWARWSCVFVVWLYVWGGGVMDAQRASVSGVVGGAAVQQ